MVRTKRNKPRIMPLQNDVTRLITRQCAFQKTKEKVIKKNDANHDKATLIRMRETQQQMHNSHEQEETNEY
jgi:hypothetical protein